MYCHHHHHHHHHHKPKYSYRYLILPSGVLKFGDCWEHPHQNGGV